MSERNSPTSALRWSDCSNTYFPSLIFTNPILYYLGYKLEKNLTYHFPNIFYKPEILIKIVQEVIYLHQF